jgi:hypothetical protein
MRGENPTGIYRFGERVVKSFMAGISFLLNRSDKKLDSNRCEQA